MLLTNDQVYSKLVKEGVKKVERGVFYNRDENETVIETKRGNIFLVEESFFDKHNIDEVLELCYGVEVIKDYELYKNSKSKIKKNREDRLSHKD